MLKLFYITNDEKIAEIADKCGVDRVWVDLETIGKEERQKNFDSVKSHHTIADISRIKPLLKNAEMLVRINPWNLNSFAEIDAVIDAGADAVMLPMWKCVEEVNCFINAVNHRVKTILLLETSEAVQCIDEILKLEFDEIHIGLNDLHLAYGYKFMFELLSDGTVERLCNTFKSKNIPYGFGGIASLGKGMLPSEMIIMEHYRLGSTGAILSRSFCNTSQCRDYDEIEKIFSKGMTDIRNYELICQSCTNQSFTENQINVAKKILSITERVF